MDSKHTVIYVPGLGDHNLSSQQRVLRLWRLYKVEVEIVAMHWLVDESWQTKLDRLLERIDFHATKGRRVSVIGTSAGSTAALQALAARRNEVHRVALICPKFQYPETVHPARYQLNPAFKESIERTVDILDTLADKDKARVRIFRPIWDNLLPSKESYVPGINRSTMPAFTHVGGIAYALTVGSASIVKFLKST